jgi:O-antigen/teichoic acid export membrane protein
MEKPVNKLVVQLSPSNIYERILAYKRMYIDAISLIGSMGFSAALGFVYWLVAARFYPPDSVGLASAAISAMLLFGEISILGMGTVLIGQIPRRVHKIESLISTAFIVTILSSGLLSAGFAAIAPILSSGLSPIGATFNNALLFSLGVMFHSGGYLLDHATVGLERGELQFGRNSIIAISKLAILLGAGLWVSNTSGMTIYSAWTLGTFLSLVVSFIFVLSQGISLKSLRPSWSLLREFKGLAIGHHMLNLTIQAPGMFLPVLITILLSIDVTASFYISWMIVSFILFAPTSLALTLYAASASSPASRLSRMRWSIMLSLAFGLLANAAIFIFASHILSIFGHTYVVQAEQVLKILALTVFPHTFVIHYVADARIDGRVGKATIIVGTCTLIQLILASVGSQINGVVGFSLGWFIGLCLTALVTGPSIVRSMMETA